MLNIRYCFGIIFLLAISPVIFDSVFAEHIDGVDDRWYYREHDFHQGECRSPSYTASSGTFGFKFGSSSSSDFINSCYFFKTFPKSMIDEKTITGDWRFFKGTGSNTMFFEIWDGEYDASSDTDFPNGTSILSKGAGQLFQTGGITCCSFPHTFNLTDSTQDNVTIFFEIQSDTSSGWSYTVMEWLNISDVGRWTFPKTTETRDVGDVIANKTGSVTDYGTVYSVDLEPVPAPTSLTANVINSTTIELNWIHSANTTYHLPVLEYLIEYQVGHNGESNTWTSHSQSGYVNSYNVTGLEPAWDYVFKVRAIDNRMLGLASDFVNATTTGVLENPQEPVTVGAYYNSTVDDRFFYREHLNVGSRGSFFNQGDGIEAQVDIGFSSSDGFSVGTTVADRPSQLYTFVKTFPLELFENKTLTFDHDLFRSQAVYHDLYVIDGALDVFNGTDFYPDFRVFDFNNPDMVLDNDGGTTVPENPWTPDVSGAISDYVTLILIFEDDEDDRQGNSVIRTFEIEDLGIWYLPSVDSQTEHSPIKKYLNNTSGDFGFIDAIFPPSKPTNLQVTQSGDDAILTWDAPVETGFSIVPPVNGYQIQKECPVGAGFQAYIRNTTSTSTTFTDTNFLAQETTLFDTDFSSGDGWTSTDEQTPIYFTVDIGALLFEITEDGQNLMIVKNIGSVSDSEFVFRHKINFSDIGTTGSNLNFLYFGLSDNEFDNIDIDSLDFIGFKFQANNPDSHIFYGFSKDDSGSVFGNNAQFPTFVPEVDTDYFLEAIRTSETSVTYSVYSDDSYAEEFLIERVSDTIPSTITDLEFVQGSNNEQAISSETSLEGKIDDLFVWSGTTVAGAFTDAIQCNYRIAGLNDVGINEGAYPATTGEFSDEVSLGSTGVSLTSPENLICGALGENTVQLTWDYNGDETADGFQIQMETPKGSGFNIHVEDTESSNTNYQVSSLNEGQEYNFKVSVIVGEDVSGASNEYSCRTSSSGGGGGSPVGDPPTNDTDPDTDNPEEPESGDDFETITDDSNIDDEGLENFEQNFPLIQELQTLFDGKTFQLTGSKLNAGLGQTIESKLLLGWSNPDNLIIKAILIADSQFMIEPKPLPPYVAQGGSKLGDSETNQLSIIPSNNEKIVSQQFLPYSLTVPNAFCGAGITDNCVQSGVHKIPVKVISIQEGQNIVNNARIEMTVGIPQVQIDIPFFVTLALVALGITGAIMVARNIKKNRSQGVKV